ncbi:hypothetical protein RJ640_001619 [Escallonia rubra]|uniref:Integrase zinc-binding domain-containing protein n=1 Tax=Escallonia rubra TaxID=112253 RepID=A0AA88RHX7_9ASTE|nr:hypothetical protein RJ640_001619 [Escallonia rubra]
MLLSGMRLVQEVEGEEAKASGSTYLASLKVEDNITSSTEQPPKGMVGVLKGKEGALPRDQPREMVGVFKGKKDAMPRGQPSREVEDVLKGKTDVVPCEFEKRQPPRRKVDREGKLDRGAKPQNVAPCGMAPPKVEKLSTTSKAKGEIIKLIKEGLQRDPLAKELLQLVKSGKTQRYRVKGGLLYTKDGRVYVPKWKDLRRMVILESHDTQSTVHPGHRRTYALVTTAYFWPQRKKEVQRCVKTCHVCRQVKGESQADEAKLLDAAVKVFNLQLQAAFKSFEAECEAMRNIRHRNLVKKKRRIGEQEEKKLVRLRPRLKKYGTAGIVTPMGDVYSYGILLMETFTRKKPTDDLFVGELTMKKWVSESFSQAVLSIVDANLLAREEKDFSENGSCLSMIMEVALNCTEDSPDERINMRDVVGRLTKIRQRFKGL